MTTMQCSWCTAIRVNEFQKIIISSNLFKYLKAKKQGFHLTPIRIIIMHELLLRKYGTNISRSNFLKVVKGNFGLELLPLGINMWTSYLVSGCGLILLIFWVIFMWVTMMLQFLVSYCHLAILLLQLTFVLNKKQNFSRIPSLNVVHYYYLLLYILLPQSQQQR